MTHEPRGMHATLHFPLPECRTELMDALNTAQWQLVVWDMQQSLRNMLKWDELPEAEHALVELIQRKFYDICADRGIEPDADPPYMVKLAKPDETD